MKTFQILNGFCHWDASTILRSAADAADAGVLGERGYDVESHPLCVTQPMALLPWLPSFPPQAFPTMISSLTSPQSMSPQSTAALTLGLLHNP